jgi:two-component system, chemotaxis family, protein-glutamate methylesterase/glutaminase
MTASPIRVLVVDDSVIVRRLVTEVLADDPSVTVVGTASNGKHALTQIAGLSPDLVTLDVEMPEMDGLAALKALRKSHPRLPVIMFSSLTQRAAAATIDALTSGANDYVTKPDGVSGLQGARDAIRDALLPKIKALCHRDRLTMPPRFVAGGKRRDAPPVRAIAIGVSTGGPPALSELVARLPADLPVPIFIVQHMPPTFTAMLARRLAEVSTMPVEEASANSRVQPGHIYLAPGG